MKKVLLYLSGLLVLIIITVVIRTLTMTSSQIQVDPVPLISINIETAGTRLAGAISIPTVSYHDSTQSDYAQYVKLQSYLEEQFPQAHQTLNRKIINNYSLLYTWAGLNPELSPVLLLCHTDVVPVTPEKLDQWIYPPFSSTVADGYIWGRGALDDKVSVIGIFEAVEYLLNQDFQPQRTVLIAIGHDEETGGRQGARQIAAYLRSQKIYPEFILDEGGVIVTGALPGISAPVGLIGIAEKGYLTLELSVEAAGGHSSMPPSQTAIGILSAGLAKIEANPLPAKIEGPVKYMFKTLAPEMGFGKQMIFANLWLFEGLVKRLLAAAPSTNAMLRTTTAVTMFNAGVRENVLPSIASATVNFRLKPGNTVAGIIDHVAKTVDDSRINIKTKTGFLQEASTVSDINATPFAVIAKTIRQVFPEALATPWLTVAGTDTKHYWDLSPNVYRFLPVSILNEDVSRIHGINERISLASYHGSISFYVQLIKNTTL